MTGTSTPLPSGEQSYSSSISTANTAEEVQFPDYARYAAVTNTGSAPIYATCDGSTPQETGPGNAIAVVPGQTRVIANGIGYWNQTSKVIPAGTNANALGQVTTSNPSTPSAPGFVTEQASLRGQMTPLGTTIKLISGTAGTSYSVELAG
jgi:hypothetical protein